MATKLVQGDKLPRITLNLTDGRTVALPDEINSRYVALLFYRGNWCSYCMRHLKTYQEKLDELRELGVMVIAATTDTKDSTVKMVSEQGITFDVAYGVSEQALEEFDPWWVDDHHGHYAQPVELLILRGGTIFGSMYASGPVGRMDVNETLNSVRSRERQRLEQETTVSG